MIFSHNMCLPSPVNQMHYQFRLPPPQLPTWQDCHELWSKKRRRQQREQESLANLPPGKPRDKQNDDPSGG
jgi:hypothetical protein